MEKFYASVRVRASEVTSASGKQQVIKELYERFFQKAFKRDADKLGIVYTPVEIVDFILRAANDVSKKHFGRGLTDESVHILDPFTGTGTFMVRLLQSGLIDPKDLARKYANELHATEIMLLAYYVAAVNIETTFNALQAEAAKRCESAPPPVMFPSKASRLPIRSRSTRMATSSTSRYSETTTSASFGKRKPRSMSSWATRRTRWGRRARTITTRI